MTEPNTFLRKMKVSAFLALKEGIDQVPEPRIVPSQPAGAATQGSLQQIRSWDLKCKHDVRD
jgi:hypothetical protein